MNNAANFFRPGAGAATSHDIFTNRLDEMRAYAHAGDRLARCAESSSVDTDAPRHNILNYHGTGGIGKTTLLRRLEKDSENAVTGYINFEGSAFDPEAFVLQLRAVFGALGVPLIAFDVALAFYWQQVHPGETLHNYTQKNSKISRLADRVGLSSSVEASLMEVASSVVTTSGLLHGATRLTQTFATLLRDQRNVRHAVASCAPLSLFLEAATAEENLTFMPALLAWDLLQASHTPPVILLDGYESLRLQGRRVERQVQRTCFLLPNVLFVVAGRDRLDWQRGELHGELDYVGPDLWPDLVDSGPGTYLVGNLSRQDADSYLVQRVTVSGRSAIPATIRAQIVDTSGGWPLHLDLASAKFQQSLASGTVGITDWAASFPALVTRLLTDMASDEATLLRSAAVLDRFDSEALRAMSPGSTYSLINRFLARTFIEHNDASGLTHALPHALRSALLADQQSVGAWTASDWRVSAQRGYAWLESTATSSDDTKLVADCVNSALALSQDYGLSCDWIGGVGQALHKRGALIMIRALTNTSDAPGGLSSLFNTVGRLRYVSSISGAEQLSLCNELDLSEENHFWVRSLRADALLSAGHLVEAQAAYDEALRAAPVSPLTNSARTMHALILFKRGHFAELSTLAVARSHNLDQHRLLGDVARAEGAFDLATEHYEAGLARALEVRDEGLANLFRAGLALVDGWLGRDEAALRLPVSQEPRGHWVEVSRLIAGALYWAAEQPARSTRLLDEADTLAQLNGLADGRLDVLVARAFLTALSSGTASSEYLRYQDQLQALAVSDTYASWRAVLGLWSTGSLPSVGVAWASDPSTVASNWLSVLARRRPS